MAKIGLASICYFLSTTNGNSSECEKTPREVREFITEEKNWRVLQYSDLPDDDKELWNKFHPGMCPGWTKVNFDHSHGNYYAVAFLQMRKLIKYEKVVIITNKDGKEKILGVISNEIIRTPLVLWAAKPSSYLNEKNGNNITIKNESLIYEKMEANSTQFYMKNGKILQIIASE